MRFQSNFRFLASKVSFYSIPPPPILQIINIKNDPQKCWMEQPENLVVVFRKVNIESP